MTDARRWLPMALVLLAAAAFVLVTGQALPDTVASHFDFAGTADGRTSRSACLAVMTLIVIGLPSLIGLGASRIEGFGASTDLPKAEAWRATEHRAEATAVLRGRVLVFAAALAGYLASVHWLVVRANAAPAAHLSNGGMYGGLAVFLVFTIGWTIALRRRFARGPSS